MPVEDHPVHPKTKIDKNFKYLCHDRKPFSPGYYVHVRNYKPDGTFDLEQKWVSYRMSALCKYDMWHSDWGCLECKWAGGQVPSSKKLLKKEEECND